MMYPHLLLWSLGVEENDVSPPPSMESGDSERLHFKLVKQKHRPSLQQLPCMHELAVVEAIVLVSNLSQP